MTSRQVWKHTALNVWRCVRQQQTAQLQGLATATRCTTPDAALSKPQHHGLFLQLCKTCAGQPAAPFSNTRLLRWHNVHVAHMDRPRIDELAASEVPAAISAPGTSQRRLGDDAAERLTSYAAVAAQQPDPPRGGQARWCNQGQQSASHTPGTTATAAAATDAADARGDTLAGPMCNAERAGRAVC
jgi:hypothetical protein